MPGDSANERMLICIKLLHTGVWAIFAGCIAVIPFAALEKSFKLGAGLSGIVLIECLILAANRCRCPLTDLAAARTEKRAANFDIYLPRWLARWNKIIFGSLFAAGELVLLVKWTLSR
jgi:hypothetical protein